MSDQPLISCICATYNRAPDYLHLVEEAIESFLIQTYPHKELIVLNDTPGQRLYCDAPNVYIFNLDERFPTLGEKQNAAIDLSRGELIAVWDDDDISLPWRLEFSVARIGDADYFNPLAYWFLPTRGLEHDHPVGYSHNAGLFRRSAFDAIGGYNAVGSGFDAYMDGKLRDRETVIAGQRGEPLVDLDDWFYLYRWGVSPGHVSSGGTRHDGLYSVLGTREIVPGSFDLNPHWNADYVQMTREAIAAIRQNSATEQ